MHELEGLPNAKYAVFDDIQGNFEFFHGYKFWLGAQAEFNVTDKYKGKKMIQWGRPSIWLCNEDPTTLKGLDYDWLMGNAYIVRLDQTIFHASNTCTQVQRTECH